MARLRIAIRGLPDAEREVFLLRQNGDLTFAAIAEALQRLSQLVTEFPQIKEMDINPFVVGREGTTPIAVDAVMTLEKR